MFSVIRNVDASPATLNNNLVKNQNWAYNLKGKQEKVFIPISILIDHSLLNDHSFERSLVYKHLRLNLHEKPSFTNCISDKINKTM